jgi:hypothetical protein
VAGVVLNRASAGRDSSRSTNAGELRRLGVPVLAALGSCRVTAAAARRLAALAGRLVSGS